MDEDDFPTEVYPTTPYPWLVIEPDPPPPPKPAVTWADFPDLSPQRIAHMEAGGITPESYAKYSAEPEFDERVAVVRKLTQGLGYLHLHWKKREQYVRAAITKEEAELLFDAADAEWTDQNWPLLYLEEALGLMPPSDEKTALINALGQHTYGPVMLTQRRELLARQLKVSVRTLSRREIEGAKSLIYYIDLWNRLEGGETKSEDPIIAGLQERVVMLEGQMLTLAEEVQKLTGKHPFDYRK